MGKTAKEQKFIEAYKRYQRMTEEVLTAQNNLKKGALEHTIRLQGIPAAEGIESWKSAAAEDAAEAVDDLADLYRDVSDALRNQADALRETAGLADTLIEDAAENANG